MTPPRNHGAFVEPRTAERSEMLSGKASELSRCAKVLSAHAREVAAAKELTRMERCRMLMLAALRKEMVIF